MTDELWRTIPEFPYYQISNLGRVYNDRFDCFMATSLNNFGHVKISLVSEGLESAKERFTRSIAQLVAEAFVEPHSPLCDQVTVLDGNFANVVASNLVWRPRWFSWKYTHQLKTQQPRHFYNLAVHNQNTGEVYPSIIETGIKEGLLFKDIWESTYTGKQVYPTGDIFEIIDRV